MDYPYKWAKLPGPSQYLDLLVNDLTEGVAVIASVPVDVPKESLETEVAELVKRRSLGIWITARDSELSELDPKQFLDRRCSNTSFNRFVFWIDARANNDIAIRWYRALRKIVENDRIVRICLIVCENGSRDYSEEKRLRRRMWSRFVTITDSRVLFEVAARGYEWNPEYLSLKAALVEELAGSDLALARELTGSSLRDLLVNTDHPRHQLWSAQVSVLFPLIDRERRRVLNRYSGLWKLPHKDKEGRIVRRMVDLEVNHMAHQAKQIFVVRRELDRLHWLQRIRNKLAHLKVVPWGMLVSASAAGFMDFREE